MRPRECVVSVSQMVNSPLWKVEIGVQGAARPVVTEIDKDLTNALVNGILIWKDKEKLG